MPHDFLPERQAELLHWSRAFRQQIVAQPTMFGLTAEQAAWYATLDDAFAHELKLAREPTTRTPVQIKKKDEAKKALKAGARMLARIVRATPGITNTQRVQLGLTVRDEELTPAARPSSAPEVVLLPSSGRTVRVRVRDTAAPDRRGKPDGFAGAAVFSYVGDKPATRMADWTFEGNMTRPVFAIDFDSAVPAGARVWIAAMWYNTRGQTGPASDAKSVRVQDGVAKLLQAA
jgi:hypothetical protein